jgi:hypothetical protein
MANPEHLQILKQGVEAWKAWGDGYRESRPDLSSANLHEVREPTPTVFGFPEPGC